MAPLRVVERLDIIEDGKLGFLARGGDDYIQIGLGLEGAPERFDLGVVVAIARPALGVGNRFIVPRCEELIDGVLALRRRRQQALTATRATG